MPELPDIVVYMECLSRRIAGRKLLRVRLASPFLLRSTDPPLRECDGREVREMRRLGKRLVFCLEGDLFVVLHLMIAGRLRWREPGTKIPGKHGLAAFDFTEGTVLLTEAGSKRRASLYVVRGEEALRGHDPGGLEVLDSDFDAFRGAIRRENHTLKRALTDPRLLSGIGNSYSDEILHRAGLSPLRRTRQLDDAEVRRLHEASRDVLLQWIDRLRAEVRDGFPEKVTAFREGMAVHGRYRQPCPACGSPVQRIIYAQNETNYCAPCQTQGKLLADRALSRLLREDWPRSLDELEELRDPSGLPKADAGPSQAEN